MAQNTDAPLDPHKKKHDNRAAEHENHGDHTGASHKLHAEASHEWFRQAKEARKTALNVDKDQKYTVQHGDCLTDIAARRLRTDKEKVDKNSVAKEEKRLRELNSGEFHSLDAKGKKKDFLADGWHLKIYDSVHTNPKEKPEVAKPGTGGTLDVPPLAHLKPEAKGHPAAEKPAVEKPAVEKPAKEPAIKPESVHAPRGERPAADIPPQVSPRPDAPAAPLPPERPHADERQHRLSRHRHEHGHEQGQEHEHVGHRRHHGRVHHRRRQEEHESPDQSQAPQEQRQEREPGAGDTRNRRHNNPNGAAEREELPKPNPEASIPGTPGTPGTADLNRSRFYTHQKDGYSCSAVSMAMMHSHQITGRPPDDREIAHFKNVAGTTSHGYRGSLETMAEQCRSQGLNAKAYEYRGNFGKEGMQALDAELAMGHTAVARIINPHTSNPHYIFIAGKTADGRYVIGDPDRKNNKPHGHDQPISAQHLYSMMSGRNGFVAGWS